MTSKVNLKARINRHSRIIKNNFYKIHPLRLFYYKSSYIIVLVIVTLMIPVYPSFSSVFYKNTVYDFDRTYIDESSIINFFYGNNDLSDINIINNHLQIFVNGDEERNLKGFNKIIEYEVKSGDSFSVIAEKYGIKQETIYWANNFEKDKILHIGEVIKIPPVNGILHKIEKGNSLKDLSSKYNINLDDIKNQNNIESDEDLIEGELIIIPGGKKIKEPEPVVKPLVKKENTVKVNNNNNNINNSINSNNKVNNNNNNINNSINSNNNSEIINNYNGSYKLTRRKPQWTFYRGNCTRYVAQYKNVTWSGNANQWLGNARAQGIPTGKEPSLGAIISFSGRGYNPRFGHVGIVIGIEGDDLIISDMNYRRLNEVTTRKISKHDSSINGYIYVD